jgi:hypothetical protein
MADVSDEGIRKSLAKIKSDRDPTDWLSVGYAEGSTDKFILDSVGTGGLTELATYLSPTFQGYAYVRIQPEGRRSTSKFVLIQYVGDQCTALQKARVIVHEEDILSVLKPVHAQISASCLADIAVENVNSVLLSAKQ